MAEGLDFTKRLPSRLPEHVVPDELYARLKVVWRAALTRAQAGISLADLEQGMRTQTLGAVIQAIPFQVVANRLLADLVPTYAQAFTDAAVASVKLVPRKRLAKADDPRLQFRLQGFNPVAARWAESHVARLIFDITEANKDAVRTIVLRMITEGIPPTQAARLIRGVIGMTPRDAVAVANFYRMAERENALRALAHMEDSIMAPAMRARYQQRQVLGEARIQSLVEQYQGRLLTARAEMIARTESTTAAIQGQLRVWERLGADGIVDTATTRMKWILTPDERLCPICASIPSKEGNLPPIGGRFTDYLGGTYDGPPAHPNCRCAVRLVFADANGNFPDPDKVTPPGGRKYRSRRPQVPNR